MPGPRHSAAASSQQPALAKPQFVVSIRAEISGDDDGELDEEKLREKQAKREEKIRAAQEKLAKREAAKKLKFARRH